MTATAPVRSPAAPAAGPAAAASTRAARRERLLRRRRQTRLAGTAFLAMLALICAWLLLLQPPPRPYFVSFALTEYDYFPSNPFAQQDSVGLRGRFARQGAEAGTQSDYQQRGDLLQQLKALREVRRPVLIVHLCAHAWADKDEVYLPATDSPGANPGSAVRLSDVLEELKEREGDNRPRLLLLDVMRPLADPRRGILLNDVADRVPDLVKKTGSTRLLVLTACSPGEESLTSEDLRHSAFAYFLERGLAGEADGYPGGTPDGRVSVQELYHYVHDRVDQWAWHNRGARQRPELMSKDGFPADGDFPLVACDRHPPGGGEDPEEISYPPALLAAWKEADRACAVPPPSEGGRLVGEAQDLLPGHVLRLQAALLRAEQQWRAGAKDRPPLEQRVEPALRGKQGLETELARARQGLPVPQEAFSLAWAERLGHPAPDRSLREAAARLLDAFEQLPAGGNPMKEKEAADAFCAPLKDQPEPLTRAAFEALARTSPGEETVLAFDRLLNGRLGRSGKPRYVETALLRRLAALAKEFLARKRVWPSATIGQALRATQTAARAASADPHGWRLAQRRLAEAADLRRQAEDLLFRRPPKPDEAGRLFEESGRRCEAEERRLSAYADLWAAYEQLLTLLPASAPAVCELGEDDAWRAAARKVRDAAELLAADDPTADQLADLGGQLRKLARPLGAPFDEDEVAALVARIDKPDGKPPGPEELRRIDALLQTPLPWAEDRAALWEAGRRLARRLRDESPRPDDTPKPAEPGAERRRAACRARTSIALAALVDGLLKPGEQQFLEGRLAAAESDRAAWDELARKLAEVWSRPPPLTRPRADGAADEKLLLAADRQNRILHAAGDSGETPRVANEYTFLLRQRQALGFWTWLRDQYTKEKERADKEDGTADLYRNVAEQCADLAARSQSAPR